MMSDFDRKLAKCIGSAASMTGNIDRALISSCYKQALALSGSVESPQVTEKWIDFLLSQLEGLTINGKNDSQVGIMVFEKIAKT